MRVDTDSLGLRALERWCERTATGLARVGEDGAIGWANAGWRALGLPAAGAWTEAELAQARASGEAVALEREVAGRWLRLVLEADGAAVFVTAVDVTAERRERDRLRQGEERWRFALEGSGLGVWDWDAVTDQVHFSSEWKRMLGEVDADVGDDLEEWSRRVHPDDFAATIDLVQRHLRGETPEYVSEHRMRHRDGRYTWILDRGRVFRRGPDGAALRVVGTHADITAQVELRERLRESEERFRRAFEDAGIGMALVSLEGRFLAVNYSVCEITGYGEAELLARDFQEITHPDDLAADLELAGQLLRGERRSYQMEKRYIRKDGGVVWVLLTGSIVREVDGRPKYFIAQVEDITARKQTEAALGASEERYRALVEAVDDAIAAFDPEGRFLYANAAAAAAMGRPAAELVGRTLAELVPADRVEALMQDLQTPLREGRTHVCEREIEAASGRRVFHTKLIPVRDAGGKWSKVISFGRDITDQRRLEAERRALAERAQKTQRLESLSVMAGGVAHDLNNLLAVVLGHADCARLDAPVNSDLADSLDQISDAARRAGELARQLLAVTGKAIRRPELVGLPGLVRETVAQLRSRIPRSCSLSLDLAPAAVEGDPAQLRQVLVNLLLNATQAVESRGGTIAIRTGVRAVGRDQLRDAAGSLDLSEGTYAFVEVHDDGCGMTPEVQSRVFEPFHSTKGSGRGLGLAVVHGVVRGHRGGVKVDSAPGRGTTIEVLLPAAAQAAIEVREEEAPPPPTAGAYGGHGLVLVVDDERAIRDSLRRVLMRLGFEVLAFESGHDALRFFRSDPTSVVLVVLDLLMPGMDGVEVLRELRKVRHDVQVVISSGFAGPLTLRDLHGGEPVRFLPKPYGLDELQSVLHEVIGWPGGFEAPCARV